MPKISWNAWEVTGSNETSINEKREPYDIAAYCKSRALIDIRPSRPLSADSWQSNTEKHNTMTVLNTLLILLLPINENIISSNNLF